MYFGALKRYILYGINIICCYLASNSCSIEALFIEISDCKVSVINDVQEPVLGSLYIIGKICSDSRSCASFCAIARLLKKTMLCYW